MSIVPQRRISKTRKRKRRTHFKLTTPGMMVCPNCGEMKLAHTVCGACYYYDGKQIKEVKVSEKTEETSKKASKAEKPAKTTKTPKAKKEKSQEGIKEKPVAVKKIVKKTGDK